MAGSYGTVFSLLLPSSKPINRRTYPLLVVSSIPTSNSSKVRHRRKNHLRPKILKTLTKSRPFISPLIPLESPLSSPQTPEENDLCVEAPADGAHRESIAVDAGEGGELEVLQVSETTGASGEYNGIADKLTARSILKYGAFFVGAFLLQTILSVCILLDEDSMQKDGDLDSNGRKKRSLLFDGSGKIMRATNASGGAIYLENQLEMEKKIEEIKLMAREARRIEGVKKEEEIGDPESDEESDVSGHRLGIEKEIGARLLKLQDRVNSDKDKSTLLQVINNLGPSVKSSGGVARDNNNVNKGNGTLKFKKKLKYRSPSTKPTKTPKGFPGIRDYKTSDAESRNSASKGTGTAQENGNTASGDVNILYEDKQVDQRDMETLENDSRLSLEDGGKLVDEEDKTLQAGTGIGNNERSNGGSLESSFGRSSVEVIQSRKSRELRTRNSLGIVEEHQDTSPILEKDDVLSINGNSKHGIADNVTAVKKVKQADTEMDMWWLNLRYVLVILMRRGTDEEGPRGLYSLKITSQEHEHSVYAYTVAFEDHADAQNLCFLLEAFFEDLGDFSADAVPVSIQELDEAVKSHGKKVVVVKKRQLQLYAGQALSDVERSLCCLVQQHQNVRLADSR